VIDGRLCLTAIEGNLKSGEIANLETIFPNATGQFLPIGSRGFCAFHRVQCLNMFMVGMRVIGRRDDQSISTLCTASPK
jgi:hypothetical protein